MRFFLLSAVAGVAGMACAAAPSVSNVTVTPSDDGHTVTIAYALTDGPAIVTLDVLTNGVSVGAALERVSGDANRYVDADSGTIVWRPDFPFGSFSASGEVVAKVTAWTIDDTPNYLVVDLHSTSSQRLRYFEREDLLPGGLFSNPEYRTSAMVFRRVPATGVTVTLGEKEGVPGRQTDKSEDLHQVSFSHDWYAAVFETTQSQWAMVYGTSVSGKCTIGGGYRPMETCAYTTIRDKGVEANYYPADPNDNSFLGLFRKLTKGEPGFPQGVDFDLPGECQWEYTCRGIYGSGYYNDGGKVTQWQKDDKIPGRYQFNQAETNAWTDAEAGTKGPESATAIVGSYAPNAWGIYDMHGNVWEWCNDWYQADITSLNGVVNASGKFLADGVTVGSTRVRRGGSWYNVASDMLPSRRLNRDPSQLNSQIGFRVFCRAGLK